MTAATETKIKDMLPRMLDAAKRGVEEREQEASLDDLKRQLGSRGTRRPFEEALTKDVISVIAEYKRHSPSSGKISDAQLRDQVQIYEENGAVALSVLTDEEHFHGSLQDLREARAETDLPILRKDFVVDPYQLYEAAVNGADAVLLIVRAFERPDLPDLRSMYLQARELDLDCLVEVHDEKELEQALDLDAQIIGINSRDLDSGDIHRTLPFKLMKPIPVGKTVVAASGIENRSELQELEHVGIDAVLVGSTFMAAADPAAKVREFTGFASGNREHELP